MYHSQAGARRTSVIYRYSANNEQKIIFLENIVLFEIVIEIKFA